MDDIHITIQKDKTLPDLKQCRTCCTNYHCPFCSPNVFKPSNLGKCKTHLSLHFHRAVFHEGYTIHRCGLGCRQQLHFHCPYCKSTLLRKTDTINHLNLCMDRGDPQLLDTTANIPTLETTPPSPPTSTALPPVTTTSQSFTEPATSRLHVKPVLKKTCPICQTVMNRKNFQKHMERKHTNKPKDITSTSHLDSECIDPENVILTVNKSLIGTSMPRRVQSELWRENQHVFCESTESQIKMDSQLNIGFIGAGNMAFGIAKGILPGNVRSENVKVSAPSSRNLGRFQELGITVTHSNIEVVSGSDVVFIAVKPHLVPLVLVEISPHITDRHIVVSVAAGVTLATMEGLLPDNLPIIRLMPNLPCVVQEGALLFARGTHAKPEHGALLQSLLHCCGLVEEGPEAWIDIHTGLSGSGVAFVYLFAEALAEGAVKMGMSSTLAQSIASQTVLGAGRLLRDSGKHPAQLRSDVCTPGGTTIHGLHTLEQGGVRASVMSAVESATVRARELGQKSAAGSGK